MNIGLPRQTTVTLSPGAIFDRSTSVDAEASTSAAGLAIAVLQLEATPAAALRRYMALAG